jgi:hypothetical protein
MTLALWLISVRQNIVPRHKNIPVSLKKYLNTLATGAKASVLGSLLVTLAT